MVAFSAHVVMPLNSEAPDTATVGDIHLLLKSPRIQQPWPCSQVMEGGGGGELTAAGVAPAPGPGPKQGPSFRATVDVHLISPQTRRSQL